LPPEREVCDYRPDSDGDMIPFLNPTKFTAWLGKTKINPEVVRPVALFAGAFAILQSDSGDTLYGILLDPDAAFAPLVTPPVPPITPTSVATAPKGTKVSFARVTSDSRQAGRTQQTPEAIDTPSAPTTPTIDGSPPIELRQEKSCSESTEPD